MLGRWTAGVRPRSGSGATVRAPKTAWAVTEQSRGFDGSRCAGHRTASGERGDDATVARQPHHNYRRCHGEAAPGVVGASVAYEAPGRILTA